MAQTWVEARTEDPERMKGFQQERLILEITELIGRLMKEQGVSKAQLAERLGTTKGYITQLLDGRTNMTLRTISDVVFALGRSLNITDQPLAVSVAPVPGAREDSIVDGDEPDFGGTEVKAFEALPYHGKSERREAESKV